LSFNAEVSTRGLISNSGKTSQEVEKTSVHIRSRLARVEWESCPDAPSPITSRAFLKKLVPSPSVRLIPNGLGQTRGKERKKGAAHKPGNHKPGATLGTCFKGFFWLLEALAASQVLILHYLQLLSSPLCCVCCSLVTLALT
jgi:hypothetical protein